MHNPARRFGWPGLAPLCLSLSVLLLPACGTWRLPLGSGTAAPSEMDHVRFLTAALEADSSAREALWKMAATSGKSDDSDLRVALLQSIPGHPAYDPVAARDRLQQLVARPTASASVVAVARLRLAQTQQDAATAAEIAQLKQRLARVVEIEKRQSGALSAPTPKDSVKESVK